MKLAEGYDFWARGPRVSIFETDRGVSLCGGTWRVSTEAKLASEPDEDKICKACLWLYNERMALTRREEVRDEMQATFVAAYQEGYNDGLKAAAKTVREEIAKIEFKEASDD